MSKTNMRPLQEFVEDYARPEEVGKLMDEVMFEYACIKIERGESFTNPGVEISKMEILRHLRDAFLSMAS